MFVRRILAAFLMAAWGSSVVLANPLAKGQTTPLSGWTRWEVKGAQEGPAPAERAAPLLTAYAALQGTEKRPVLLMITGSKCLPLFRLQDGKVRSPLFFTDAGFFSRHKIHGLVAERRGIRSFETIPADVAAKEVRLRCGDEYGGLTKDVRIRDVLQVVRGLSNEPWFGDLLIVGHSEGVDVAMGVARELGDRAVSAVGLFAGASPSLLFDLALQMRKSGNPEQVKSILEDMFYLTSGQVEGKYGGYPVRRMMSFAIESDPLSDALHTSVPLFVASGTRDVKASIESADLFVLEVLRKQPRRILRYVNYTNLDHDFRDSNGQDLSASVFDQFIRWSRASPKQRELVFAP